MLKMTNSWDQKKHLQLRLSNRNVILFSLHPSMNGRLSSWQVWQDWMELYPYIPSVFDVYLLQSSNLETKTSQNLVLRLIHQFHSIGSSSLRLKVWNFRDKKCHARLCFEEPPSQKFLPHLTNTRSPFDKDVAGDASGEPWGRTEDWRLIFAKKNMLGRCCYKMLWVICPNFCDICDVFVPISLDKVSGVRLPLGPFPGRGIQGGIHTSYQMTHQENLYGGHFPCQQPQKVSPNKICWQKICKPFYLAPLD